MRNIYIKPGRLSGGREDEETCCIFFAKKKQAEKFAFELTEATESSQ